MCRFFGIHNKRSQRKTWTSFKGVALLKKHLYCSFVEVLSGKYDKEHLIHSFLVEIYSVHLGVKDTVHSRNEFRDSQSLVQALFLFFEGSSIRKSVLEAAQSAEGLSIRSCPYPTAVRWFSHAAGFKFIVDRYKSVPM